MRAQGYACDVCKVFAASEKADRPPVGWMTLTVEADKLDHKHICSNACLKRLGNERARADKGQRVSALSNGPIHSPEHRPVVSSGRYDVSEEGREAQRQNGIRMQHRKGNHAEIPNPNCGLCQQETDMSRDELQELVNSLGQQ